MEKKNVVLSGIYYPVAILRYFEAALRRRSDINLVTVGPYSGAKIPWNGGMTLRPEYAKQPNVIIDTPGTSVPSRFAEGLLRTKFPDFKPDLWIQVDAGFHLAGALNCKNFIIATDPHALNYDRQRNYADTFFCMQTPYMQASDVWLPYAYDPIWHRAATAPREYRFDVGFVGALYDNRRKLVDALKAAGLMVMAPGYGPAYEEARSMQILCKVGINYSSLKDLTARVFELMAMRSAAVINRVPDLEKMGFVEGKHYLGFDTVEEGVAQVKRALYETVVVEVGGPDAKWSEQVSLAESLNFNASVAVEPHTYDARIEQVLSYV